MQKRFQPSMVANLQVKMSLCKVSRAYLRRYERQKCQMERLMKDFYMEKILYRATVKLARTVARQIISLKHAIKELCCPPYRILIKAPKIMLTNHCRAISSYPSRHIQQRLQSSVLALPHRDWETFPRTNSRSKSNIRFFT